MCQWISSWVPGLKFVALLPHQVARVRSHQPIFITITYYFHLLMKYTYFILYIYSCLSYHECAGILSSWIYHTQLLTTALSFNNCHELISCYLYFSLGVLHCDPILGSLVPLLCTILLLGDQYWNKMGHSWHVNSSCQIYSSFSISMQNVHQVVEYLTQEMKVKKAGRMGSYAHCHEAI